jgi:hypothetical protein
MSFDWKGLIGTVAPSLASAFGTPLAGLATSAICQALGLTPKANADETQTDIQMKLAGASPTDLLALKNAEQQFQKDMKSLDIDLEKLQVEDRANARDMQVKTRSWAPPALAAIVTVGFFGVLFGMLAGSFSSKESPELLILIGSLGTAWGMIISFYFGSSWGSQSKDATIHAAITKG